jgi:hypothetical protein
MKSYRLSELSDAEVAGLKARPRIDFSSIFGTVKCHGLISRGIEAQRFFFQSEIWNFSLVRLGESNC